MRPKPFERVYPQAQENRSHPRSYPGARGVRLVRVPSADGRCSLRRIVPVGGLVVVSTRPRTPGNEAVEHAAAAVLEPGTRIWEIRPRCQANVPLRDTWTVKRGEPECLGCARLGRLWGWHK